MPGSEVEARIWGQLRSVEAIEVNVPVAVAAVFQTVGSGGLGAIIGVESSWLLAGLAVQMSVLLRAHALALPVPCAMPESQGWRESSVALKPVHAPPSEARGLDIHRGWSSGDEISASDPSAAGFTTLVVKSDLRFRTTVRFQFVAPITEWFSLPSREMKTFEPV